MAKCPFATWDEINGSVGDYSGGPFKIVHHTTEGSTYAGARAAFAANKSDPHFTVAGSTIYQHIDTGKAARALKNAPGGVETNRDSAVQIEVVGFAAKDKDATTLASVAKLCRWIEGQHGIPQAWPNGFVRWSHAGADPGGHNRNALNWDSKGGHYGHSQVPENSHWDPGYTPAETNIVTPDAAQPAALLEQVHLLTGWSGPAQETAAPTAAYHIASRVVDDLRAQLSDRGVAVFPEGVDQIEVRVTSGNSHVEVRISGRAHIEKTETPPDRHSKRRRPPRRRRRG